MNGLNQISYNEYEKSASLIILGGSRASAIEECCKFEVF